MKLFIHTYGCTLNQSDSEVMAGLLSKAGHLMLESEDAAELVVFNTCTVKDNPEKRFFSDLKKAQQANKKIVVAGCVSQADPHNPLLADISLVGVSHISQIAEAVAAVNEGRVVKLLDFSMNPRLNLPKMRKNQVVEIIPILAGCLGECSFCKTRFARGRLRSYEPKEIRCQMEEALNEGVKEIWLTSQDNGAYGKDIGSSLPELLKILLEIKGDYKIRIGMINPNHLSEFVDELVPLLRHKNVFKFIHIPLQSGTNSVLKAMNRKYTTEEFVMLVDNLRKEVPGITIATDIICGFSTEKEEDFQKTCDLIRKLKVPVMNITKFYPRKGTPAFNLTKLPTKTVKRRNSEIVKLQSKLITNKEWIGWEGNVLIDGQGKEDSMVGRNDCYKPVIIKGCMLKQGAEVKVRIVDAKQHYLEGKTI